MWLEFRHGIARLFLFFFRVVRGQDFFPAFFKERPASGLKDGRFAVHVRAESTDTNGKNGIRQLRSQGADPDQRI